MLAAWCFAIAIGQTAGEPAPPPPPRVVILTATGETRDGLPVVAPHPDPAAFDAVLNRGYARRVVRLYAMAQRFAKPDVPPQPAYLVLTDNQGGFPRRGFFLDTPQPGAAYIDLHRRSRPSGRAGAVDQIFPHELLHVIVGDLAGPAPRGQATQMHAIGVRTDRITAFNEGFAEHGQIMAIDDPDAPPDTRAIASDGEMRAWAFDEMRHYRRAMTARWSVAPRARMTFPFWFSRAEQVLRYHAVRDNLFARAPEIPERLLNPSGAYHAYLLDNVLPGDPGGRPRSAMRMLVTEGVVSALFQRLVTNPAVQRSAAPDALYARFGTTRAQVDGLDNAYLKIFAAIHDGGYDALSVVRAYQASFPEDAAAVEGVLRGVLLDQPIPRDVPQIWLLNADFEAGSSLFDQFKGAPNAQAFDLNACSAADLAGVPGLDPGVIARILEAAPFASIEDMSRRVRGITAEQIARFHKMHEAMLKPVEPGTEKEGSLSFKAILLPYLWRALAVAFGCVLAGVAVYRRARPMRRRYRLLLACAGTIAAALLAITPLA